MEFKNYETLSASVKEQINKMANIWVDSLGDSLIGIYLHGSIALNCFVEGSSDIDILIVSDRKISRDERLAIAKRIIEIDYKPSPLEMSAIWINDLKPWKYPTPCQFHYSDYWTEKYNKMLSGEIKESFIIDEDFTDEDIACHVNLINQSGICIYGKEVKDVFPLVPEKDFWNSISSDIEMDFNALNPRYFVSNILSLGRVLSYKYEKKILSKYDAGIWTLNHVPERFKYIIDNSIKSWYLDEGDIDFKEEDLNDLKELLINEIQSNLFPKDII